MILLDRTVGSTLASTAGKQTLPEGSPTVIILERDGTLRHQPPDERASSRQATVSLHEDQADQTVLDRLINFTFDVLGIGKLEVRVYEHQER